jgi:aminoglycoside phosphotransferase (APT) family kinase protein
MPELQEIRERLARYLDVPIEGLRVLASGWETTVFEFATGAQSRRLPPAPAGRTLALRFYQGSQADAKGPREYASMDRLAAAGYCVPQPYLFEPDRAALGAPFLILERLAGGPLFATTSFPQAFKTFSLGFFGFVRAQVRLHRYDPESASFRDLPRACVPVGTPLNAPLLDRMLALIAERIERGPLPGLKDALERLRARAHVFRTADQSLLHMDYHPQNVMVAGMRVTGIIDWVNTDVGDRHLDAAMTAVILSSSAMEHPRWMRDNLAGNTLRATFASLYVPLYHAMAHLDWERFRYCQAVAALLRLSMLGMMRARGPEAVGFRAEAIREVSPGVIRLLTRYAARKSGTAVGLDLAAAQPA